LKITLCELAFLSYYFSMADNALSDMLSTIIEGGIIMSRALSEQKILVQQILLYRNYLRLIYGNIS